MKRKKRTFYANDSEYSLFQKYAQANGKGVSVFLRDAANSEMSKHTPKKKLRAVIEDIVLEEIEKRFPARGNTAQAI